MPWDVRKTSEGKYEVIKQTTGEVIGTHPTRTKAEKHLRALYANEPGKPSTSPGTIHKMQDGGVMALDSSYQPQVIEHGYVDGKKVPFAAHGGKVPFNVRKFVEEFTADYPSETPWADRVRKANFIGRDLNTALDRVMKDRDVSRDEAASLLRTIAQQRRPTPTPIPIQVTPERPAPVTTPVQPVVLPPLPTPTPERPHGPLLPGYKDGGMMKKVRTTASKKSKKG